MIQEELIAIEEDIKKICGELDEVFFHHGIGEGEQNNFWTIISTGLQVYTDDTPKLLERWSSHYGGTANVLTGDNYVNRIKELTNRIYLEDEKAEHIVRKLERLSTKKEKKVEEEIRYLLGLIKKECKRLMITANSLQKLIDEMIEHGKELKKKLQSETNLEKLKDDEYRYAENIRKRMIKMGEKGWKFACKIYSEDEKAEHLFKKVKSKLLT